MELNSRIQSTLIAVTFLIFITISIPWYVNIKEVKYVTNIVKMEYSDLEASETFEDYSSDKIYFKKFKTVNKIERSLIPTIFNCTEIKKLPSTFFTNDRE